MTALPPLTPAGLPLRAPGRPARRRAGPGPAELAAGRRGHRPGPARLPGPGHATSRTPRGVGQRPGGVSRAGGHRLRGPPLTAGGRYRWKVRVWDESRAASGWSDPARFEVELDRTSGWHASWIGPSRIREAVTPPSGAGPVDPVARALTPAPYLRRAFTVDQPVASARLYVTALGLYEARLNGRRVGDGFLTPGWTDYTRRIAYQTYDVTGLLAEGENVLGAILADGWYAGFYGFDAKRAGAHYGTAPELLAQLVLRLADGSEQRIVTDGQWESSTGAIRHADLLMGERHDLALEPAGWDMPGFDARRLAAGPVPGARRHAAGRRPGAAGPGDPGDRAAQHRHRRPRPAHRRLRPEPDRLAADHSRRAARGARPDPARRGARGRRQPVHRQPAHRPGRPTSSPPAGGAEVLEPRFTLHGFRYAEITGYPGDIGQADITARVVHSDTPATGIVRVLAAVAGPAVPQHRLGPAGQLHQRPHRLPAARRAARLARRRPGLRPHRLLQPRRRRVLRQVAGRRGRRPAALRAPSPTSRRGSPSRGAGAPAWGDAGVIVPWTLWKMYGDTAVLDRHFGAMTRWMDFLERANPDYLRARELGNSYNDWLAPGDDDTPHELLATAYWAHDAALMAEIADATGRPDDAAGYRALRAKIRSAFTDAFVAADGQVTSRHPDRLRPRPAHEPDPRRPAGRRGGAPRGRRSGPRTGT